MRKSKSPPLLALLLAVLALFAFGTFSAWADDVVVVSTTDSTGTDSACPPSCPLNLGTTTETATYAVVSPNGPTPRKAKMAIVTSATWEVQPTVADGAGIYKVFVAKGTTGSCPTGLRVAWSAVSGIAEMRDTNGVVQTSIVTPYFSQVHLNNWFPLGEITVNSTTPRIKFAHSSGAVSRWYMDAVRFQLKDACTDPVTVAPKPAVTGPLTAGATTVNVKDIVAGTTLVDVYDVDTSTIIGSLSDAGGLTAGTHAVTVTALVKGHVIKAAQTGPKPGGGTCYSGYSDPTPKVGGGANPKVNFVLGCQTKGGLAGPAGTSAGSGGTETLYWVHATATVGGASAMGPVGGYNITPSTCWETYTFDIVNDPCRNWLANTDYNEPNTFAVMESLVFGIDASQADSGPYDIYIDNIKNGSVVLADFENQDDGTPTVNFANPVSTGGSPPPSYFLSAPNSTEISQVNKIEGTNSLRVRFQFSGTDPILWCRLIMNKAPLLYPQVAKADPVTVSVLVLPVGSTVGTVFNGTVGDITNSPAPFYQTGEVDLGATVTGSGSYTYSWDQSDGLGGWTPLGVTTQTMHVNPLPANPTASVTYRLGVNDGGCTLYKSITLPLTIPTPAITTQPVSAAMNAGGAASIISVTAADGPYGGTINYYQWYKGTDERDISTFAPLGTASYTSGSLGDVITAATPADSGFYYCEVVGAYTGGSPTSSVCSLLVVPSGTGSGTGLRGQYYDQASFTGTTIPENWGGSDFDRTDKEVNFQWGNNIMEFAPGIQQDHVLMRWTGTITPLFTGAHDFIVRSDDGYRLWIDNTLVGDYWIAKGATELTNSYSFADLSAKSIILEFMEIGGDATVQLIWCNNGGGVVKTFVPPQQLTPAGANFVVPTIALATPSPNSLELGGTVNLSATVTTNNGIVKQVEFYYGGTTLIGTATTETAGAWVYTGWAPPAAGVYTVTAKVVFNESEKAVSAGQTVTVLQRLPVTITSVVNNGDGTITINYTGGAGGSYTLMKTTDLNLPENSWTPLTTPPDNGSSPGSFIVTPAGNEFYAIRSNGW